MKSVKSAKTTWFVQEERTGILKTGAKFQLALPAPLAGTQYPGKDGEGRPLKGRGGEPLVRRDLYVVIKFMDDADNVDEEASLMTMRETDWLGMQDDLEEVARRFGVDRSDLSAWFVLITERGVRVYPV